MADLDRLVNAFTGADPIAGTRALQALVAAGERGEEALFAAPIAFPSLMQARRRWLRYVASRGASIAERLLDRLARRDRFQDQHASAFLFAGLRGADDTRDRLFKQLDEGFTYGDYYDFTDRYLAWGYLGGDASVLWHRVSKDHFKWEKLSTFAFRAACSSCARVNTGDLWTLEQLITHRWEDYTGLVAIGAAPDEPISNDAIHGAELAMQAIQAFSSWRRGDVADRVLQQWSSHPHWRVRSFGAQILAALGFQRTVAPVLTWLEREPVSTIRAHLLHALECSGTTDGADALVGFYRDQGEGEPYVAKAAWRATDGAAAAKALESIAAGTGTAAGEALVSLARLGQGRDAAGAALGSRDNYVRLNAALALGYLQDRTAMQRLVAMRKEASAPIERVFLAAATAMLGQPEGGADLHRELLAAAGDADFFKRIDLFFLHRYLREAILDAFAADERDAALREAWQAELDSLDPLAAPVELPRSTASASSTAPAPSVVAGASQPPPAAPQPTGTARRAPLKVFVSYSHADEKMRKKLGAHLAPMVAEQAIQIWHDREIEAGADWEREIDREIDEADLILLLVSATFLDSPYCRKELRRALDRRDARKASAVPIILRPCDWASVFNAKDYKAQALPRDNRPVAGGKWPNQDTAYALIAAELRKLVERLRGG